jgi:uncharacterized delta-60 repeat protein
MVVGPMAANPRTLAALTLLLMFVAAGSAACAQRATRSPSAQAAKPALLALTSARELVPDRGFGEGGRVSIAYAPGASSDVEALRVDGAGRVLVAGASRSPDGRSRVAIVRLLPDGRRDSSFSDDGEAILDVSWRYAQVESMVIDRDGGALVAISKAGEDSVIVRVASAGEIDRSFGVGGIARVPGGRSWLHALALQRDGRIIAVGERAHDLVAARFTAEGRPDPAFSDDGVTIVAARKGIWAQDVALDRDRILIAAAAVRSGRIGEGYDTTNTDFAVVALGADGALDDAFGDDGIAITPIGQEHPPVGEADHDEPSRILIRPDGGVLLVGRFSVGAYDQPPSDDGVAIAIYTVRGKLDRRAPQGGVTVSRRLGSGDDVVRRVDGAWVLGHAHDGRHVLLLRLDAHLAPTRRVVPVCLAASSRAAFAYRAVGIGRDVVVGGFVGRLARLMRLRPAHG